MKTQRKQKMEYKPLRNDAGIKMEGKKEDLVEFAYKVYLGGYFGLACLKVGSSGGCNQHLFCRCRGTFACHCEILQEEPFSVALINFYL